VIYFSDFGAGLSPEFGALVYQAAGGQSISTPTLLTWDSEAYDFNGWHSTSSDASRMTVISGVTLVRVTSNLRVAAAGALQAQHLLSGATFLGQGKESADTGGADGANIISAPIVVSAGQYFELEGDSTSTTTTSAFNTWMSIEIVDGSIDRALVNKTANQAIGAGAFVIMNWGAEAYDTNGFHDNAVNNSRLTVPSTGRYRVIANISFAASTGQSYVELFKNGARALGLPAKDTETAQNEFINCASGVVELTAGDYLEVSAFNTNAINVLAGDATWFSIEEIPSSYVCCLVNKSANQSISGGADTVLAWGAEVYDDDAMHDNTTDNSRIYVPAGCTRARPSFSLTTSSVSAQMAAGTRLDGATYTGAPQYQCDTGGGDNLSAIGAWVDVTPGQYFEVVFFSGSAVSVLNDNRTWFCLECQ